MVIGTLEVGCSPQIHLSAPAPGSLTRTIDAEWDNVKTAVEVGSGQAECSVLSEQTTDDGLEHRFEIKHVTGKHGLVSARMTAAADSTKAETIELACQFGPTPDPELERRVLARVAHRLNDLRGKAFAPILE